MPKRILNVISCAYRATLEEQDDPILWLTHSMRKAEGAVDVLLCANAVAYAARQQDGSGLAFGARRQTQAPHIADDVAALAKSGASVYYVVDDARARGLDATNDLIEPVIAVEASALPELFSTYDLVFQW